MHINQIKRVLLNEAHTYREIQNILEIFKKEDEELWKLFFKDGERLY